MIRMTGIIRTLFFLVATWSVICGGDLQSAWAQEVSFSGWFHVIWGDSAPGASTHGVEEYVVIDDQNRWIQVDVGDGAPLRHDHLSALNRKRIKLSGRWLGSGAIPAPASQNRPRFQATSIQLEFSQTGAAGEPLTTSSGVFGSQRWLNILCRFADSTNVTPRSQSYVQSLMGSNYPGMDHYWRESSFGNIDLAGTIVVGWYNLPQPRSYYIYDYSGDGVLDLDFNRAAQDCTAAADADVYFPDYSGINLMFNELLDCCAWGGSITLTRDGQMRMYSMTWLPPWGYTNQGVIAHEMGHGFGLPHSSGPYGATYDSRWDVMSNLWGNCPPHDPVYGCIGVHTVSHHKDQLGWIPPSRSLVVAPGGPQTIFLDRLGQPASGLNYHIIKIPIGGLSTQFYTVETRRFNGYDSILPGEAVVIHKVDTMQVRPAQVVDVDNNGDPNDVAAMWLPGEQFVDGANGIGVSVDAVTSTGFQVTVMLDDSTPPTGVALIAPVSGQIASGTFTLKGTAQDNSGIVQKMEFYIDTDSSPVCFDSIPKTTGSTFQCNWNTLAKPNGSHDVIAKAYDAVGNFNFSSRINFNINNDNIDTAIISVVTPNGGEDWAIRSRQLIQWTSSGVSGNVAIFLSRDGGPWLPIVSRTANDGVLRWRVDGPATTQDKIRVCSVRIPSVCGASAGTFTIH